MIKNKWYNYVIDFEFPVYEITREIIEISLDNFYKDKLSNLKQNQNIHLFIKIISKKGKYKTISLMQTLTVSDYKSLITLIQGDLSLKDDYYYSNSIDSLGPWKSFCFNYRETDNSNENLLGLRAMRSLKKYKDSTVDSPKLETFKFGGLKLPNTMDLTRWGKTQLFPNDSGLLFRRGSNLRYHFKLHDHYQEIDVKDNNDKLIKTLLEKQLDKIDLTTFKRVVGNQNYYYNEGKLLLKTIKRQVKFLSKLKISNWFKGDQFITMDIETRIIHDEMRAYAVSLYDGSHIQSFYLSDYNSESEMLIESVKYLMKRKYDKYKVYIHNFSNFDSVFLLSALSSCSSNITPIIRDGRFIEVKFYFGSNYSLYFRDSYLLLPSSLRKLGNHFNIELNKGIFPYKFVTEKIGLDYNGEIPEFNYFTDISLDEYNNYVNTIKLSAGTGKAQWNLREQTLKYCELDCIVLHKILNEFSKLIYEHFRISIDKYPTISSLAFGIYRSNFLKESKIPLINGETYDFIKEAYTGGAVDVYKHYNKMNQNDKVYRYDVNSLYPFVMKKYPMPVGSPVYFEGDIMEAYKLFNSNHDVPEFNKRPFGIFEVEITAPTNINIPILQCRLNTETGIRTVSPVGTWTGKYFSEELYNAENYGYKYKIIRGYTFEKDFIFEEYVDIIYTMRLQYDKNDPMNLITKLLLNSLYGRLGMSPYVENHSIIESKLSQEIYSNENYTVTNVIELNNGYELISYYPQKKEDEPSQGISPNISVAAATAVTAWARVHMTFFKMDPDYILYYSDTDSIDISKPLDKSLVGKQLGKMKLEYIFDQVIYLAPKAYGGKGHFNNPYEIVKNKGLKVPVKFEDLKPLLYKDTKYQTSQVKWYKDIQHSTIRLQNELYTLSISNVKRKLIYDDNNKLVDTLPLKLEKGKLIID